MGGAAAGVGGELAEQGVPRPAADDVDRPDRRAEDGLELLDGRAVLQRQALQGAADERPLVAGVFYNRLRIREPLQCDPTVLYALAVAGRPEHSLNSADLHFKSPYNTYQRAGLPPGPIANPGEGALRAALSEPNVPYFYFVANGDGGHSFSRTLAEHNRNVASYRHRLAQEGDGVEADEAPPPAPPPPKPAPRKLVKKKKTRKRS